MALTRKMLKAMGIEDEKIDQIIEAHTETVDALKEQRDQFKAEAEKLPNIQKQLDDANKQLASADPDEYKVKYEQERDAFKQYKQEQEQKENHNAKLSAYKRDVLAAAGIPESKMDTVAKFFDVDALELVDGKVKDAESFAEKAKTEWSDIIPTTTTAGAQTANPPANNQKIYSRDEIRKMTPAEINANFDAIKASLKGES